VLRRALLLALCGVLLSGCASVTSGTGRTTLRPSASPSGFPSPSSTGPVSPSTPVSPSLVPPPTSAAPGRTNFNCPVITYPHAHLQFDCIVTKMKAVTTDKVWPLDLYHVVEPRTGWSVSMGAGHWGPRRGNSLLKITSFVRSEMVRDGSYGTAPKVTTLGAGKVTINGAKGFLLESRFKLSAAFRHRVHTAVHSERSWIVAVYVGRDDLSLWYVSIPDTERRLWRAVHDDIASMHVV
jgi:hypothetical protein